MAATTSKSPFMLRVIMKSIRSIFPKVHQLETDALDSWIKDEDTDNFVILDVREKDEQKVSHLPSALFINPEAPGHEVMAKVKEQTKVLGLRGNVNVVTYCDVGMRASIMAQRIADELERMKESEDDERMISLKVYNLEGAIFKWTNEGKQLVDTQGQETQYCHPFSYLWGILIPPHTRKYKL